MYVELHARSGFSFLEGASVPEELVGMCAAFDMPAMAIMDRNGVYGAPRFHMAAKKTGRKTTAQETSVFVRPGSERKSLMGTTAFSKSAATSST